MPKRKTIRRPAKGFAPPKLQPPVDAAMQVDVGDIAEFLKQVLQPGDRRELSERLLSRRSFRQAFKPRPELEMNCTIVVHSNGSDIWVEAVPEVSA